jgi:hypothetical protein
MRSHEDTRSHTTTADSPDKLLEMDNHHVMIHETLQQVLEIEDRQNVVEFFLIVTTNSYLERQFSTSF